MLNRLPFLIFIALSYASVAQAFFRLSCQNALTIERADPILSPGKVAGHTHIVSGGSGFSPSSNGADLRASECSSCLVKEDLSAYWSPSLYFQFANGSFASINNLNGGAVYYKLFSNPSDTTNITAFPDDFRMIAGNSTNRDPALVPANRIEFVCLFSNGTGTQTEYLPPWDCDAGLRTSIIAPSCWDGINVDSPDHQSHIQFPTWDSGPCPPGFPVRVPSLRYEISYNTGDFTPYRSQAMNPQQPYVFANGDPTGHGYHFDFLNGWTNLTVLQNAINQCTGDSGLLEDCPPLTLYPYDHACHRTPDVNEAVTGMLPNLPGYNPVNWGPSATGPNPNPSPTIPGWISNPVVYNGSAPPPSATVLGNSPRVLLSSGNYVYQDCYLPPNSSYSVLSQGVAQVNKTVEGCLAGCDALGLTYCAVAAGGWNCVGGMSIDPVSKPTDYGLCNRPCVDNGINYCGGWNNATAEVYMRTVSASSSATSARTTVTLATTTTTSTTVTPAPTPSIVQSYGNWSYSSCYIQNPNTPAMTDGVNPASKSVESCLAACDARGFNYCSVSYGGWTCEGGIDIDPSAQAVDASHCTRPCVEASGEYCGGYDDNTMQVYTRPPSITILATYNTWSYSNCYTNWVQGTPTLSQYIWSVTARTMEACLDACTSAGYSNCGMNGGDTCYGGNGIESPNTVVRIGECNIPCADDPTRHFCGGEGIAVYTRPPVVFIVPQAGNYTYNSCYQGTGSSGSQTLATTLYPAAKTVESCIAQCELQQFAWCGVQYLGNSCFGSNTLEPSSTIADPLSCATYCLDAPAEQCGGYSSLGLYSRIVKPSSSSSSIRSSATRSSTIAFSSSSLSSSAKIASTTFSVSTRSSSPGASVAFSTSSSGSARSSSSSTPSPSSSPKSSTTSSGSRPPSSSATPLKSSTSSFATSTKPSSSSVVLLKSSSVKAASSTSSPIKASSTTTASSLKSTTTSTVKNSTSSPAGSPSPSSSPSSASVKSSSSASATTSPKTPSSSSSSKSSSSTTASSSSKSSTRSSSSSSSSSVKTSAISSPGSLPTTASH